MMVGIILLSEGQGVLPDVGVLYLLDDAFIREVGVALQHVLVVEYQFVEDGRAIDADGATDDGTVRVEPYLLALADDAAHEQRKQSGGSVGGILAQEWRTGDIRQQREEGITYSRGGVGIRVTLITYALK